MIAAVVGTRPEVIKMAPVVHALRHLRLPVEVVATGQHHDHRMLGVFLEQHHLQVDHFLERRPSDLFGSFIDITASLGDFLRTRRPDLVLAVGDTTTVLGAALAARKLGASFGHVESGLRAFSRELPEEEHRICADALADLLFAPTRIAEANLAREHVNGQVIVTGNTVLDALRDRPPRTVPDQERRGALVTLHRQETVDDPARLADILFALDELARRLPVVWPLHPRTRQKMAENGLVLPHGVEALGPLDHTEFLDRLAAARLVVTDSGGVQEEAAIVGTPSVVVRRHTERPETIKAGVGILAGTDREGILAAADEILSSWADFARPMPHLYGDGRAAEKIAGACAEFLVQQGQPGGRRALSA